MTRRHRWLAAVLVVFVAGCGPAPRDEARDSLVKQLQEGGLDQKTAECVVESFFASKTDDELKGFFDRPELTPEEAVEFAALGKRCASSTG
ncbi:MAG: hypothetical protein ABI894_09125 [Ilumatobacteraceae bacterium]